LVVYATFVYFRRVQLLSKALRTAMSITLAQLSLRVASGVLIILLVSFSRHKRQWINASSTKINGLCHQHSNKTYQPNDLVIDNDRDMLLVPSLQRIVGHSTKEPNSNVVTLVGRFPTHADIEGSLSTLAGDRLFALSEKGGRTHSSLIELCR
jgi:hypothetical protein